MKVTLTRVNGRKVIGSNDLVYCNTKYHSPYLAVISADGEMIWQEKIYSGYGKRRSTYYSVEKLMPGDHIQAAGGSGGSKYPFKGRVISITDTEIEVEQLSDEEFSNVLAERQQTKTKNTQTTTTAQPAARYILNSAVITAPGCYDYRLISVDAAKEWLSSSGWKSTIGYQETADALRQVTGIEIPVDRMQITMNTGDEALVFRLTTRINADDKGKIGIDWIKENSEIGLLRKVEA